MPKSSPPAKFVHDVDGRRGMAVSSLVSGDCIVSGATVRRSLLFTGVRANSFSTLEEAVVLPQCHIGRGARLRRVVIDRGVNIPEAWWLAKMRRWMPAAFAAPPTASV